MDHPTNRRFLVTTGTTPIPDIVAIFVAVTTPHRTAPYRMITAGSQLYGGRRQGKRSLRRGGGQARLVPDKLRGVQGLGRLEQGDDNRGRHGRDG